jgi:electron transfer flavoprotein alpha/beta subunit
MSELHISVCIKSVPDPRCPVKERLDPATGLVTRGADAQGIPRVMSPMDRLALDAALRIRDERPARVIGRDGGATPGPGAWRRPGHSAE